MEDELAEWKAQRETLRRHLAWLDAEIARREAGSIVTPTPKLAPPPVDSVHLHRTTETLHPATRFDLGEAQKGLSANSRAGCILLGLLFAGLGLGLIFGLPYLIYR